MKGDFLIEGMREKNPSGEKVVGIGKFSISSRSKDLFFLTTPYA